MPTLSITRKLECKSFTFVFQWKFPMTRVSCYKCTRTVSKDYVLYPRTTTLTASTYQPSRRAGRALTSDLSVKCSHGCL